MQSTYLLAPLVDGLVEALLLLLERRSVRVGTLNVNLGVIEISSESRLGLVDRRDLRVGGIESLRELVDLLSLATLSLLELVGLQ